MKLCVSDLPGLSDALKPRIILYIIEKYLKRMITEREKPFKSNPKHPVKTLKGTDSTRIEEQERISQLSQQGLLKIPYAYAQKKHDHREDGFR